MEERAVALLVRLLDLRKERAALASRRAQQEFLKARDFSQQVDAYACEYDEHWARSVVRGDQVEHLHNQAAFTDRLQATAAQQRDEARWLEGESQRALSKAVQEAERLRALREWMQRQQRQRQVQAERLQERALEDVLQARRGSR